MTTTATADRPASETPIPVGPRVPPLLRRAFRGAADQPRWARPALLALLVGTAVLYLWGLGSHGWGNDFYAAAVQAGTQNPTAWLFGSLDAGNAITVDKPPAALWVMVLAGRLFGFSAVTMLVPQVLLGVGAVALVHATVRRCSGPGAGLMAGTVLALTPVFAVMFRYNNPDALLVFLLVLAAYCTLRATETASTRWMALAGVVIGFAFLTKMMQAFLVVPALAAVFLVAAPGPVRARIAKLLVGAVAIVVSAGWYIALVSLWPSSSRPYIGGSTDNSLLQLALGYNGMDRVLGGGGNPGGGHHGGGEHGGFPGANLMFGGQPGIGRMFGQSMGTEISWLLPAALVGLLACIRLVRGRPRTDVLRAGAVMWGGWLLVTAGVFSFMDGTIHPYYTVALAPAIAALVGISVRELWRAGGLPSRIALAVMSAGTGVWAFVLLGRTPEWLPALRWIVLIGSVVVAVLLVAGRRWPVRASAAIAGAALLFGLAAPAAYTVESVIRQQSGPMPTAGPQSSGFHGPQGWAAAADNAALRALIDGASDKRWAAASIGSMTVSPLELRTGASIMAIGGFTGSDNSPTLAQFQQYVADRQIGYFIAADGKGGPRHRPGGVAEQIAGWVGQHYRSVDVGGAQVYDLSVPVG